jgi:hypothetical protein
MESLLNDIEILSLLYRYIVQQTSLQTLVSGRVLYDDTRSLNATTEDILLVYNSGSITDFQRNYVYVRVYVNDIEAGQGVKVKDVARVAALPQNVLRYLAKSLGMNSNFLLMSLQIPVTRLRQDNM